MCKMSQLGWNICVVKAFVVIVNKGLKPFFLEQKKYILQIQSSFKFLDFLYLMGLTFIQIILMTAARS